MSNTRINVNLSVDIDLNTWAERHFISNRAARVDIRNYTAAVVENFLRDTLGFHDAEVRVNNPSEDCRCRQCVNVARREDGGIYE